MTETSLSAHPLTPPVAPTQPAPAASPEPPAMPAPTPLPNHPPTPTPPLDPTAQAPPLYPVPPPYRPAPVRPPSPPPRWPGSAGAGPVPLVAAVGGGLLAAALVPLDRPGLGWALAGLAVVAATVAGVRRPGSSGAGTGPGTNPMPGPETGPGTSLKTSPKTGAGTGRGTGLETGAGTGLETGAGTSPGTGVGASPGPVPSGRRRWGALGWGSVAVVLLAAGTLRSAEWLFGLCLFGAAAAIVLAVTAGRPAPGLVRGALLVPVAAGRGTAWGVRGLIAFRRHVAPGTRLLPTAAVTAVLLLGFGALLASADAATSRLLLRVVPGPGGVARGAVVFAVAAALVLAATVMLRAPAAAAPAPGAGHRGVRLVEWAVPVGALVALFTGYVGLQLTVLFGGAGYVLGPDSSFTYAQYARGGFWQLLTVTALTLVVIGLAAGLAPRRTPLERWCLRGLLAALAGLTLVIVASALFRMHIYQEAYGFTRLRVLVSVVELWLGLVFLLVLVAAGKLRAGWLPRAVAATGVVAVLALVALNPDRFIAERNIDRWVAGEELDPAYLAGLSPDAVPALVCLPDPYRQVALARVSADLADDPDDWRSANLARITAQHLLAHPGLGRCAG